MACGGQRVGAFISTKEHRRLTEFADAVRRHGYIGLCHGVAGVGKTLSARRYARWDVAQTLLKTWGKRDPSDLKVYDALARSQAVFYTPTVGITLRELRQEIPNLVSRVNICIQQHRHFKVLPTAHHNSNFVELLIIDEADRLSTTALEYLRDLFDRHGIGLILIGMPGIDKRLLAIRNSTAELVLHICIDPYRMMNWLSC
jgi:DNA transposition AAA+ family ATPase